ncbi:hypothetical protein [Geobacillus sp. BMUD]|uniref:hypothetical protein n=1 Tax=Geobacillus sp. BMUD TaxID=2508876 RepID=UPI00209C3973|nr:hypothetical protein [Geobacillus sp. BMUD]
MRIIVGVLLVCQTLIIYAWISDWRQLVTPAGLFLWVGGIAVGLAVLRAGPIAKMAKGAEDHDGGSHLACCDVTDH